jgi:hypothetical protein
MVKTEEPKEKSLVFLGFKKQRVETEESILFPIVFPPLNAYLRYFETLLLKRQYLEVRT